MSKDFVLPTFILIFAIIKSCQCCLVAITKKSWQRAH